MIISLNSLACKNRIITYQDFKICILKAYAYSYKSTHYPWDTDYPLSSLELPEYSVCLTPT